MHNHVAEIMSIRSIHSYRHAVDRWPLDLTSGPSFLAFHWPGLTTKVQRRIGVKEKIYFKILFSGAIYDFFCFGPSEFDLGYLKLWVTGPDEPLSFVT